MGIKNVGKGIKKRLETINGLKVFAPNELPDSFSQFPVAVIMPRNTYYNVDFDASPDYIFRIILLLTSQDKPSSLDKLMDYIESTGDKSFLAAIEGDRTLDGYADDCMLSENTGFGAISWGGYLYLGTEFELKVWG